MFYCIKQNKIFKSVRHVLESTYCIKTLQRRSIYNRTVLLVLAYERDFCCQPVCKSKAKASTADLCALIFESFSNSFKNSASLSHKDDPLQN